ncbi:hypothetical protein AB0C84_31330 [Actinomadura sp. NPDC048955]|uniref:hypothetical protein n=1 Tax=Actinomadura sp. NPDC048955 TaxID=3158228 RepID=UPI00340ED582
MDAQEVALAAPDGVVQDGRRLFGANGRQVGQVGVAEVLGGEGGRDAGVDEGLQRGAVGRFVGGIGGVQVQLVQQAGQQGSDAHVVAGLVVGLDARHLGDQFRQGAGALDGGVPQLVGLQGEPDRGG